MADFTYSCDFPVKEEIAYKTLRSEFDNGAEQRRGKRSSSVRKFTLSFSNRTKAEMEEVKSFFIAKLGGYTSFTWTNPNDSVDYTVTFVEDSFSFDLVAFEVYNFQLSLQEVL